MAHAKDTMARLGINVDHVATIRQARKGAQPDPVHAAVLAELAGADGITIHLREDRRHIQDRDLRLMRETVKTKLNLEMAATNEMVRIALEVKPDQVTFVPERREEVTTEGGLDVVMQKDTLPQKIKILKEAEIEVSLFIDPDLDQVKTAHKVGADAIEIHTGAYCEARPGKARNQQLEKIVNAVKTADKLGLTVHAGHGLDYHNVLPVAAIAEIEELNIGHSIISRAVMVGLERAVREMKALLESARR
jgi:pyridoxine 5-phosphate synthase